METGTVRIADTFDAVRRIAKQLDRTNIRILSAMWRFGPRNLLEISRRTGIPFTSVYHRVRKLEGMSGRIACLMPQLSKLGLTRVVVLLEAKTGEEECVRSALKIPNFWRSINPCEGAFTFHSVHAIPLKYLHEFKAYLKELRNIGLINELRIIRTGDQIPNFADFQYYDPEANRWILPWGRWLSLLKEISPSEITDPTEYQILADKKDLLIVKELEKNARKSFAELAPVLGVSLQGVKYRFDKRLVPRGIVKNFDFDVYPYPIEVSAYHEIMLEFPGEEVMNKFFSLQKQLFFILATSKVVGRATLVVRTCILQSQLHNMFRFFSEMAKEKLLESYSALRLSFDSRETQTTSYELFDDENGWTFDSAKCVSELHQLVEGRDLVSTRRIRTRQ